MQRPGFRWQTGNGSGGNLNSNPGFSFRQVFHLVHFQYVEKVLLRGFRPRGSPVVDIKLLKCKRGVGVPDARCVRCERSDGLTTADQSLVGIPRLPSCIAVLPVQV